MQKCGNDPWLVTIDCDFFTASWIHLFNSVRNVSIGLDRKEATDAAASNDSLSFIQFPFIFVHVVVIKLCWSEFRLRLCREYMEARPVVY